MRHHWSFDEEPSRESKLGNEHGEHEPVRDLSLIPSGKEEESTVHQVSDAGQENEPPEHLGAKRAKKERMERVGVRTFAMQVETVLPVALTRLRSRR